MGRRSGILLLAAVLATGVLAPGAALAAPAPPGTYENPLDLRMPNGDPVVSCADPDVIKGVAPDTFWYLYCTTDPLTEDERNEAGDLVFHAVPMFRSADLVTWDYVGDAFPERPSWIPANGGIWAPEIVHDGEKYLLYYGAPDTNAGGSAIGVATSDSPTGPWVDSGGPVVDPTDTRWQFDPEVIEFEGKRYLYFGSYFGGVFVRELTADGLDSLPETEKQIAIANRYEGTVIVEHDGWFYFMGSATNCCNGPLTGYAVFSARSQSPFGPFVDRSGVSILDGQVGGTPMIAQNGNRWVGLGHHTVFTDFGGQDWSIYHAVDQGDPYFEGEVGFTKRPALLDPVDWQDGWPVLRGGYGPSDEPMPAPAAQPGQVSAYEPEFIEEPQFGETMPEFSDDFDGPELSPEWSLTRESTTPIGIEDGSLVWATQPADLHPPAEPRAAVLTRDAPAGDYMVETKVTLNLPPEGCCFNYVQGGLVIYGDDGNYVKLVSVSIWETRQTEFGKNVDPVPEGYPGYGNTVGGPAGDSTWLRILHEDRDGEHHYTAFTSIDGELWERAGTWTHELADPKIGLVSMAGSGFVASFDYVRVTDAGSVAPSTAIELDPAVPSGDGGWYTGPVTATVTATDDVDPSPSVEVRVDGGEWQSYSEPVVFDTDGEHVVEARSTDAGGNTSAVVTAPVRIDTTGPSVVPSSAEEHIVLDASDELSGVALIEYAFVDDGEVGEWSEYSGPIPVEVVNTTVAFRATDVAGNVSAEGRYNFAEGLDPVLRLDDTSVTAGQRVTASVSDAVEGEYELVFRSEPQVVATLTVGADGTASGVFRVPADASIGSHVVQLVDDSGVVVAEVPVQVVGSGLASTGVDAGWAPVAALLLLLVGAALAARRRTA